MIVEQQIEMIYCFTRFKSLFLALFPYAIVLFLAHQSTHFIQ